jgi:hypothetical protein
MPWARDDRALELRRATASAATRCALRGARAAALATTTATTATTRLCPNDRYASWHDKRAVGCKKLLLQRRNIRRQIFECVAY